MYQKCWSFTHKCNISYCEKDKLLLAFQAIEGRVQRLIIPFIGNQLVVGVDDGESINLMGAQERVHILGHKFPSSRSVLGPVGEVAHHLRGSCWRFMENNLWSALRCILFPDTTQTSKCG